MLNWKMMPVCDVVPVAECAAPQQGLDAQGCCRQVRLQHSGSHIAVLPVAPQAGRSLMKVVAADSAFSRKSKLIAVPCCFFCTLCDILSTRQIVGGEVIKHTRSLPLGLLTGPGQNCPASGGCVQLHVVRRGAALARQGHAGLAPSRV